MDLTKINENISGFVWGPVMIALMLGIGIYLTIRTDFFQIKYFGSIMKNTLGSMFSSQKKSKKEVNITPFQAVSTALAGTIGTGNIAGVATALISGGAGAVFWMWISALFGMMTKYGEVVLAVKYRNEDKTGRFSGGPMYYIKNGLNMKWLAVVFSILCVFASFGIGNIAQSNSISDALNSSFNIPTWATGMCISALCGFVLIGGINRISKVTEFIVPFMAFFYITGCVIFLCINASQIRGAFALIFDNAFNVKSGIGGIMGYNMKNAIHYGVARGVFTNEAGLGSAPIAHGSSNAKSPVLQGMWGIFEVFFDTIVICTMTALVILTAGNKVLESGADGGSLTTMAFSTVFGTYGASFIAVAIVFFAVASILGWAFYGQKCIEFMAGGNNFWVTVYKIIFTVVIYFGATINMTLAWSISDSLNGLMAIPNLAAVIVLSPEIIKITKEYKKTT